MRTGILADIHGNAIAFESIVADATDVDQWICLGDVVGYGPDPKRCLQILSELRARVLLGNHEARLLDLPTGTFNEAAEAAILYARSQLAPEDVEAIARFETTIRWDGDALFCHGAPHDRDHYLFGADSFRAALAGVDTRLVVFGHSHRQLVFDGTRTRGGPAVFDLDAADRWLINPGSVGQPRDGDARAAYAVLDDASDRLALRRVEYDVAAAVARFERAGLPPSLGQRLREGR